MYEITDYPAYNNGEYCMLSDLSISILDFGFIHSDATYDVLRVENGVVCDLDEHLTRFEHSCAAWRLALPSRDVLVSIVETLVAQSPTKDLFVWVSCTRGIPDSGNPRDLNSCKQRLYAYTKPYYKFNTENTATVCISKQVRNTAFDQQNKNFAWNDLTIAQFEANDLGFDTAILCDNRGFITEGPGFNVGFIKDEVVYAPQQNCLKGITMENVRKLAGDRFVYTDITVEFAHDADAVFLTSTAGNIISVSRLDSAKFNSNELLIWLQKNI
jgi:branched-chain amino acid aminotransferase